MTTTYIFYSCDQHKTRGSLQAKFTFNAINAKKVLKFIERNMADYFEGSPTRQRDNFNCIADMVKDGVTIHEAINISTDIYATCEQIDSISQIQY